jgi:dTDP-4-dehydrorhamnose reductase
MTGEMVFLTPYQHGNTLVRTTGLYGRNGHHDLAQLVRSMLSQGNPLPVSKNLMGNQTYIPHFAEALINIANRPDDFYNIPILNVASQEVISRYEFALMVASVFELDKKLLLPVTNKYISGWVAERPTKGGLKVNLARKMKVPIYNILDGLKALKNDLSDNSLL